MRPLGTIVMSAALLIAAWSALSPTSIETLGADYDCGPPLVRMAAQESSDDPNEQHRIDRCEDRSIRPLLSAAVIVVAGVVGGLIILRIDRRRDARARAERARQRAAALTSIDR
ncbi:MAG: hypothetical protein GXY13_07825 [Acidimicrobiales bacterium]|nr:hypothetical protein [Acidimicrobiales bacterium]